MQKLQKQIKELYKKHNLESSPELLLIAMQEELGEVAACFLSTHYKSLKTKSKRNEHSIGEELGDLMFLILAFCNEQNIDCEKWIKNTRDKLEKRQTNVDNKKD